MVERVEDERVEMVEIKTCSGELERRVNFERFLEEVSMSLFDPSLAEHHRSKIPDRLKGLKDGSVGELDRTQKKKISGREIVERKVERKFEEQGISRKLSYMASEISNEISRDELRDEFSNLDSFYAFASTDTSTDTRTVELGRIYGEARKEAWEEFKEMVSTGNCKVCIPEIKDTFSEEIVEELKKAGFVEKVERGFYGKRIILSGKLERIIARRVLEIALRELEAGRAGEFESEMRGHVYPTFNLVEFDECMHTFDMLDIQESMLNELLTTGKLEIGENAVAREFERTERVVHIIPVDSSDSMKGEKLRSAIKASLALKEVAKEKSRNLKVFAFNDRVRELKKDGELLNLRARGRTNIALALRVAANVAAELDATPVVFLVTDGEPTSPENPVGSAIRAAADLGRIQDSRLVVYMLNREDRYVEFCTALTRRVKKSAFLHVDPSRLTLYMLRHFGL